MEMKKCKSQRINSMHLYPASRVSDLSLSTVSLEDQLSRNNALENHQTSYHDFALLFFFFGITCRFILFYDIFH